MPKNTNQNSSSDDQEGMWGKQNLNRKHFLEVTVKTLPTTPKQN